VALYSVVISAYFVAQWRNFNDSIFFHFSIRAVSCVAVMLILLLELSSLFLVYTSVTPIATAMVLLYRFYCIFVHHVLIILDLYFASWAAVRA